MSQPVHVSPDLDDLIQRLDAAARRSGPHAICQGVKETLIDLATQHASAIPEELFEEDPARYARRLIHRCPNGTFSVMIMVWAPGQGTAVHDHAGKWCVECVLRGQIEITAYTPHGDPSTDAVVELTEAATIVADVGDVGILVPPNEYHRIRNAGSETAATIHVYAGELLWCHTFRPHPEGDGFTRERSELCYNE